VTQVGVCSQISTKHVHLFKDPVRTAQ